jgi:BirA family transcriptional regulator, biotin operon repressor / biotin---[acetyl-CoA-carboxylase] ligase
VSLQPLLALLMQSPSVSGADLATQLGVSRAAVWKQIDRLRALGLDIEARAGAGYRLQAPLQLLDGAAIGSLLSVRARGLLRQLDIVVETGSTSSDLLAQRDHLRSGTALIAEAQSAGRGQRGRSWQSPLASGFLGSLFWRFDRGLSGLGGLSLAMGVCVVEALAEFGVRAQLKWPNDIMADDRKLGGILIDAGGEAQGDCHVVIGLGLNGRLPGAVAQQIDQPSTDLHQLLGRDPDRNRLAAALLSHLCCGLHEFAQSGFAAFHRRYQALDGLHGRAVEVHLAGGCSPGIADGVDDSARLCVTMHGVRRKFDVGEVRVQTNRQ